MIPYLLLFITAVAFLYAIINICILLSCNDIVDESLRNGVPPDWQVVSKADKVLTQLCYLAATIVVLLTLIKASANA